MACSTGIGDRGWNKRLRPDRDRVLIAVGTHSPNTVVHDLERGLAVQQGSGSAPLSKRSERAVGVFRELLGNAWESVTGRPATENDITSIMRLVTVRAFDFEGADGEAAEAMLEQVLGIRGQASVAFRAVAQHCQDLMSKRTGSDLGGLQQTLSAMGVSLTAAPSFQRDTERLKDYSSRVHGQLSEHESIDIGGKLVAIKRKCTDVVVDAARNGSLLLVGEPGAGKSAVLNASAGRLRDEGRDVLILAVDRLPVESLEGLRIELGIEHPLYQVLVGWPGDKHGYLFIDALDATRGGQSEAVFRALITEILSLKGGRWRVIASIRSFDLRMGVQFKQLFPGQSVSTEFLDPAFGDVRHLHVPTWTDDELDGLLRDAPALAIAIDAGGERLRDVARVPFNTRLMADLLASDLAEGAFNDIKSQVQLLSLYWSHRVEKHGAAVELCLKATVNEMVESRSLRANKLAVASPGPAALDSLLREGVMIPMSQGQYVAFRHHILFDYAASRVYLDMAHPKEAVRQFSQSNGLGLVLAPALSYSLLQLWSDDETGREWFWATIALFCGDSGCDPVARSVAARTASELPEVSGDAIGLLAELLQPEDSTEIEPNSTLGQVVGALFVRFDDGEPVSLDPWCELAERASEHVENWPWALRAFMYALYERADSDVQRAQLGRAARKLLAYCLDSSEAASHLTRAAIDFVGVTYESDIEESRRLLRRLFELDRFREHGDQDIPQLVNRVEAICSADPAFAVDIYALAFGYSVTDQSTTRIGDSQILPLSSTRRQDYEHAWWRLGQFYPDFLSVHPLHAVRALVEAIAGYVKRAHPKHERARVWNVYTPDGNSSLYEDHSCIWAWDIDEEQSDSAQGLLKAFVSHLETTDADVARSMVKEIIRLNELAVIWARTLMVASKRPDDLGELLWSIATQEPLLESLDTQKDNIDFIAARYPFEGRDARESFEREAISFQFKSLRQSESAGREVLSKLFSRVGKELLATAQARDLVVAHESPADSSTANPRPFRIDTGWHEGPPDQRRWLRDIGIDPEDAVVAQVLTKAEGIEETLKRFEDEGESVGGINDAISVLEQLIDTGTEDAGSLPEPVVEHIMGSAADGVAKLCSLPVERLAKERGAISSLVRLVLRLARVPGNPPSIDDEANFEAMSAWDSRNVPVDTATAAIDLCKVDSDTAARMHPTIKRVLLTGSPAARMQIAQRLTTLWNTDRPLMWELAKHVAHKEPNRGVLRFFANQFLYRARRADPQQVERLVLKLQERMLKRVDEPSRLVRQELGGHAAILWHYHDRVESFNALTTWISEPSTFEPELTRAISNTRNALVLKYQDDSLQHAKITERAHKFVHAAVTALAARLETEVDNGPTLSEEGTESKQKTDLICARLLHELCRQMYFASGAFRSGDQDRPRLEGNESKKAFLDDVAPMLRRIADVGVPSTIHTLVELLEFLLPADPPGVFDLLARALLHGGKRYHYQSESMAADRLVKIVGLCLADHRELFEDEARRQTLVECLGTFVQAGWPAARRLLYRLPELLQ